MVQFSLRHSYTSEEQAHPRDFPALAVGEVSAALTVSMVEASFLDLRGCDG